MEIINLWLVYFVVVVELFSYFFISFFNFGRMIYVLKVCVSLVNFFNEKFIGYGFVKCYEND